MKYTLAIHNYAEIAAFLVSVLCWSKIKGSSLKWFTPFLLFIVLVELTGKYIRAILNQPNAWLYNLSTVIEFVFYTFIFYSFYQRPSFKKLLKWFMIGYPVIALVNIFLIQGIMLFHSNTMIIGSFFMILFSCLFFYELLQHDHKINLVREPMFWISTGILFFYAGDFFYNLFFSIIFKTGLDNSRLLFKAINNNLIVVLYSCFSIGFVCQKKLQK